MCFVLESKITATIEHLVYQFMEHRNNQQSKLKTGTTTITLILTKDCQLACKYCFQTGKNSNERMSISMAKQTVNFVLDNDCDDMFSYEYVVWNLIGGEPFLEIDLIDELCAYILEELKCRHHHWNNKCKFCFSTNGINYSSQKVQNFIRKYLQYIYLSITIDGTKYKHDLNRVYKNTGLGSYEDVVKNIPLWQNQFPNTPTKVTISSPDIPYVCESVIHLFDIGISKVNINYVHEDVWKEGDDIEFENQLMKLADIMIEDSKYKDCTCSFFDQDIGQPLDMNQQNQNGCGAGNYMIAIDASGEIYPCYRFAQYSLRQKKAWSIGNVSEGIDKNKLRPFTILDRCSQSTLECLTCEVADGCTWCQGENYDSAKTPTVFERSTAGCLMHKARVRANNYYWSKLGCQLSKSTKSHSTITKDEMSDIISPKEIKEMLILLDDTSYSICNSPNPLTHKKLIPISILKDSIYFCNTYGIHMKIVYPPYELPNNYEDVLNQFKHIRIGRDIGVYSSVPKRVSELSIILTISMNDFINGVDDVINLMNEVSNIEIYFINIGNCTTIDSNYEQCLLKVKKYLDNMLSPKPNINLLNNQTCQVGLSTITLAPNGNFYLCQAFYYDEMKGVDNRMSHTNPVSCRSIGNLYSEIIIPNRHHLQRSNSPLCLSCGIAQCQRCLWLNQKVTLDINTPSYQQCVVSKLSQI